MSWYAKPSGPYSYNSEEGKANILEIASFFSNIGYTEECQAGIIGNIMAESGLNPWRWQGDSVNLEAGYGLFQYTPARSYIDGAINLQYYAPNKSVTDITSGAKPTDGLAQLNVFDTNLLGKWISSCWRDYWDTTIYSDLYKERERILSTYGTNNRLSMNEFKVIDNVWDSTFSFLACFEGPKVPNIDPRYSNATIVYKIITGNTPDPPDPPGPIYPNRKLPVWMMVRPF